MSERFAEPSPRPEGWLRYRDRHQQVKMALPGHPDGRVGRVTFVRRNRSLLLRWRQDGRYRHERIGLLDEPEVLGRALARAGAINLSIKEDPAADPQFRPVSVAEACDLYLAEKEAHPDVSGATLKRYGALLAHVRSFAATPQAQRAGHLHELDTGWCERFSAWLDTLQATRNGCPPTESNPRRFLSMVGKREIKQRLWSLMEYARVRTPALVPPDFRNPMGRELIGRKPRRDNGLSAPPVSAEDLVRIVGAADRYQLGLLAPLFLYGPRPSELGRILRADLDLARGLLFMRSRPATGYLTKGRRDKTWPVTKALLACLQPFIGQARSLVLFPKRKVFEHQARQLKDFKDESELAKEYDDRKAKAVIRFDRALKKTELETLSEETWAATGAVDARDVARELERAARQAQLAKVPTPKDLRHLVASEAGAAQLSDGVKRHILGHAPLRGDMLVHYSHTDGGVLREQVALLDRRRAPLIEALLRRARGLALPSDHDATQAAS